MSFYGRRDLEQRLEDLTGKHVSSFVTCRGRRRIGKSTLIEHFARKIGARFIKIEGLKPCSGLRNEDELRTFAEQLSEQTESELATPANWLFAFKRLDREIENDVRTVVLLDEVSWLGQYDKTFSGTLKIAWDNMFKKHDRLIFVVCGSVSTWIRDNIIDNKAFYGRRSLDLIVKELPLSECVRFWGDAATRIPTREIFDILAVTGGVPKYLEEINPALSAAENLRRMCFHPKSPLRVDFDEMFTDVITKQPSFTAKVLRALVDGPCSLTEIADKLGVVKSGNITDSLVQLVESGLLSVDGGKNPVTGTSVREQRYRIKDNYARFYLKYIEPVKDAIDSGAFVFSGLNALKGWPSVMGLAFESMVVNHVRDLLVPLHLENALVTSAAPYVKKGSSKTGVAGCQIDLLIQTAESFCLVEIKRKARIGLEIIEEMKRKVAAFPSVRGKAVRTALVYDGDLDPVVPAQGYFDAVVSFDGLLGL